MKVYLALGSNLGDRLRNLRQAREALQAWACGELQSAGLYETDPLDCPLDSPLFLNTVVSFETALEPLELLEKTQALEQAMGREAFESRNRHAPRPLDVDLLLCDETVLQSLRLTLPHPRLHLRRFVLYPLRDLAPTLVPPTHANPVAMLLELCESPEQPPRLVQETW